MHQYKIIVQILLVLQVSIFNPAFAAPIPRDTTSGNPSPDKSLAPPHESSPGDGSTSSQIFTPSSGSTPLSHLSTTDEQVSVSTTEPSTPAHPATDTATTNPVPLQDPIAAAGSTTVHSTGATNDVARKTSFFTNPKVLINLELAAAVTTFVVVTGGLIKLAIWTNNRDSSHQSSASSRSAD